MTRTITLTNSGDLPGGFFVAVISGGDVGSFRLLHESCTGRPLDPSASCTAQVRFQPESSGRKVAQLSFFGDQDGGAQVNLTGVGVDADGSLTPGGHDFGRQALDTSSREQTFALSNDGANSLPLSGASVVGADADQFRLSADACTDVTLPAGGQCEVQVRFAPDSRGAKSARLRITGDAGPKFALLAGTAVAKRTVGVRFRWRDALRPHGARLIAGNAACQLASRCRLRARALVLGDVPVKLPTIRMALGGGATRPLRLRLTEAARAAARSGGRLQLELDWIADGHHGRTRSHRGLAA